jgi:hypothetical protein
MTPHNFMLTFVGTTTKVEEIVMPEIPATLFNFKDFAEILAGNYQKDLCIGKILIKIVYFFFTNKIK